MDDPHAPAIPAAQGGIGDILPANMDALPSAPLPPQPLIEAPLIDAAIADLVAIQDAASHAVIDGPASAQCSC